ncbi:MAG: hypothetical protein HYZ14_03120 [Bacteroidetes bacterium]|nr:hypothetical protein [Bacteroidota bacterium]
MTENNNVVSLQDQKGLNNMSGEKPTYYTVEQLFERYPTIMERGWTQEHIGAFADGDLFINKHREDNTAVLEIEKESFENFLKAHNEHLLSRVRRIEAGFENLKKKPVPKK